MMLLEKSLVIFITLLIYHSVYSQTDFSKTIFTIAGLDSTETLSVNISSKGCSHQILFDLVFTKGDTGILVSMFETDSIKNEKEIGHKQISITQAVIIDGYLQYLRKPPKYHATCTTEDTINLVWKQSHLENNVETFSEGSCFSFLYPYTFWNIYDDFRSCCIEMKKSTRKCKKNGIHCN